MKIKIEDLFERRVWEPTPEDIADQEANLKKWKDERAEDDRKKSKREKEFADPGRPTEEELYDLIE